MVSNDRIPTTGSSARAPREMLATLLALVTLGAAPADQTFTGVISDRSCAASHASMRMGPTDAECTQACIDAHGDTYVLVTLTQVYALNDQRAPRAFAGKKVTLVGTLDEKTGTIAVTSIAAAE
jgi:hypothetical protein